MNITLMGGSSWTPMPGQTAKPIHIGWREYFIATPQELQPVSSEFQPLSVYLGALGMAGLTAWAGLRQGELKAGETIYISGAAGAVGSVAGQLAKLRGCRVKHSYVSYGVIGLNNW